MQHVLILSLPRFDIPYQPNVIDIMNTAIHNNLVNIDYFGPQMNDDSAYIDAEMSIKIASTTYITIHFDDKLPPKITYKSSEDEIFSFILSILMRQPVQNVILTQKDIAIFIG
jgi:hypothetical protein